MLKKQTVLIENFMLIIEIDENLFKIATIKEKYGRQIIDVNDQNQESYGTIKSQILPKMSSFSSFSPNFLIRHWISSVW